MDYKRIHRLLKILTLIQSADGWTARRLAEEFGVADRTIRRDLAVLSELDIPYFYDDEKKCYQLRRDFFMPPLNITLTESLALIALTEHISGDGQIPMTCDAATAIAKIRAQLPQNIQNKIGELDGHVAIHLNQTSREDGFKDMYDTIRGAIVKRQGLECKYESLSVMRGDSESTPFIFQPYLLLFKKRAWYVVGHHARYDEVRNLRLDRFESLAPTDQYYDIPESFNLDDHLGNAWSMMRGESHDVEILFDKEFADTIASTYWHPTQEIEYQDDQSILFKCNVEGLDEILWWVLSMGHHATVKQPQELIDRVSEEAKRTTELYTASPPDRPTT